MENGQEATAKVRRFQDFIDKRPFWYKSLYVFPLAASTSWLLTITTLLCRWIALGRPRYDGQVNPDIPFISDIAAFTLKPFFVAGGIITGITYFGTVLAVHHVRYSPRFYGPAAIEDYTEPLWRKTASLIALVAGILASVCLVLLAIFDTFDSHVWHRHFLLGTFAGLALSSLATTSVWWDQTQWYGQPYTQLRLWCNINLLLVFCLSALGAVFVGFMFSKHYYIAGVLEWTLTYLGAFWMATFVAYVR